MWSTLSAALPRSRAMVLRTASSPVFPAELETVAENRPSFSAARASSVPLTVTILTRSAPAASKASRTAKAICSLATKA
ncbi:hypothetical protein J2S50_005249 [Streptomyces sp. DSM 40167]|nr:hypothetical protein [Streptomyces sp. DSM 40167]